MAESGLVQTAPVAASLLVERAFRMPQAAADLEPEPPLWRPMAVTTAQAELPPRPPRRRQR